MKLEAAHIPSAEDVVFEQLRERILHGLTPMTQLRLSQLADELGVSTMPVRGALQRLEADGFVVSLPRRGTFVAPLSAKELNDIQVIRRALEPTAARLGAERLTDRAVAELNSQLEKLQKVSESAWRESTAERYLTIQRDLHDVVYEAAGNELLHDTIRTFRRMAERYVRVALARHESLMPNIQTERRLVDACTERDGDAAGKQIDALLQWTLETLRSSFE